MKEKKAYRKPVGALVVGLNDRHRLVRKEKNKENKKSLPQTSRCPCSRPERSPSTGAASPRAAAHYIGALVDYIGASV